jgi:D-threo-aldose 1-dehydrogenase
MGATMDRRRIGKTPLRVGPVGFGAAPLGNLLAPVSDSDAAAALAAAWSNGCRYFDTAPFYGYGLSERRVGDGLRERARDEFLLSTKVGRLIRPGEHESKKSEGFHSPLPFRAVYDYSYDGVMRSLEDSYQRLGLDRIDLALMHDVGRLTHGECHAEVMRIAMSGGYRALEELRRNGQVAAIGLGVNEIAVCQEAMASADFDCFLLAGRYTLMEQEPLNELFPACQAKGISIIVGGPFNSGVLVRAEGPDATYNYVAASEAIRQRVRKLSQICASHGVLLPAAALQFCLAHPVVASVIPGARNAAETASHWQMLRARIPAALWAELRAVGLLHPAAPTPPG